MKSTPLTLNNLRNCPQDRTHIHCATQRIPVQAESLPQLEGPAVGREASRRRLISPPPQTRVCVKCDSAENLQTHHIDGNHDNNSPENLMVVCAVCHAKLENRNPNLTIAKIEYENLKDLEKTRISIENRAQSLKGWGIDVEPLKDEIKAIKRLERDAEKRLVGAAKDKPIFDWLISIDGVAKKTAAEIIALIGDVGRFNTISSLWHYSGLHVEDGKAPKFMKGEKISYYPKLKSLLLGIIGDNFIRNKSPYKKLYDSKKEYYEKNRDWTKLHRHRAAIRFMVKQFVKDLWLKWRELDGLSITNAHPLSTSQLKSIPPMTEDENQQSNSTLKPQNRVIAGKDSANSHFDGETQEPNGTADIVKKGANGSDLSFRVNLTEPAQSIGPNQIHSHPTHFCLLGSSSSGVTGLGQRVLSLGPHTPSPDPNFFKVLARLDRAGEGNAGRANHKPPCTSGNLAVMPLRRGPHGSWIRRGGSGVSPPMKLNQARPFAVI